MSNCGSTLISNSRIRDLTLDAIYVIYKIYWVFARDALYYDLDGTLRYYQSKIFFDETANDVCSNRIWFPINKYLKYEWD